MSVSWTWKRSPCHALRTEGGSTGTAAGEESCAGQSHADEEGKGGDGLEVEVAMTASAERFIAPLTFAALTGRTVHTSMWQPSGAANSASFTEFPIEHIALAELTNSGTSHGSF